MKQAKTLNIQLLQQEATKNKALDAVCHVFALRKRSRSQITIHGLQLALNKEGFSFSADEYASVLYSLAKAGVGTPVVGRTGKIKALSDITITLQSLGKTVVTKAGDLKSNRPKRKKFTDVAGVADQMHDREMVEAAPAPKAAPTVVEKPKAPPVRKAAPYPAFLTILIEGKPVTFTGPTDLTADSLADFLGAFQRTIQRDRGI